jgi:hypothetical protein
VICFKKEKLAIGDLIWAKMRGHPHWPATVVSSDCNLQGFFWLGESQSFSKFYFQITADGHMWQHVVCVFFLELVKRVYFILSRFLHSNRMLWSPRHCNIAGEYCNFYREITLRICNQNSQPCCKQSRWLASSSKEEPTQLLRTFEPDC